MIEIQPGPTEDAGTESQGDAPKKQKGKSPDELRLRDLEKRSEAREDAEKMIIRWVKVSLSLVTTGAAANRALAYLEGSGSRLIDPFNLLRIVTIALAVVGVVAIWAACVQHWETLRRIERGEPPSKPRLSLGLAVGIAVAVLVVVAAAALVVVRRDGGPVAGF